MVGQLQSLSTDMVLQCSVQVPSQLVLHSVDVIHCLTLPTLGVKSDVIPGRLNSLLLSSLVPGVCYGQCSELCGALHGFMPVTVSFN